MPDDGTGASRPWPPGVVGPPGVLLPLQFPSLGHLDARIARALALANDVEGLRLNTIRRWQYAATNFRTFLVEARVADRFLRGQLSEQLTILDDWIAWLRTVRELSQVSIRSYWTGLAAVFARISRIDAVANPWAYRPVPRATPALPRFLSRKTAVAVLRYVQDCDAASNLERTRNVVVVGLMLLAGLRRQETMNLCMSDVDLAQGTLRIRRGKGRHGGRDRFAYMPPQLSQFVEAYLDARRQARRLNAAFLVAATEDRPLALMTVRRLFMRISQAVGEPVTPHALRHTCGSLLREAGVSPQLCMDLLGHRSVAMLLHYSHTFNGEQAQAASRLRLDDPV